MKLNVEQVIDKYKENINKNGFFMMNSLEEEIKYIAHNNKRFGCVLNEIDSLVDKMGDRIRILDIGTSPFTFILRERYKNAQIYSIDYTGKFEKLCESKKIYFKRVDLNKQKILFGKTKFNIITFLEVLEHLSADHKKIIENIICALANGGHLILQTPNKYSPKAQITNVFTANIWNKLSEAPAISDEFIHFKEYSLGELLRMIGERQNLKIVKKVHAMYFDEIDSAVVYRKHLRLFKPLIHINRLVVKNIPLLRRGMQIIFQKIG